MEEIHVEDQFTISSFEEIKKEAHSHYAGLYSESDHEDYQLHDQALSFILEIFQARDNEELTKKVTEEEILATLM